MYLHKLRPAYTPYIRNNYPVSLARLEDYALKFKIQVALLSQRIRPRDVLVSRNSATTKYRYRVALFA